MVMGILGFFVVVTAIQTVVLEVRGESAVLSAVTLAVLLLLFWLAWRARRNTGV
jgi:hypothetical protein